MLMRIAALYIAVIYAASPALANAEEVTWDYSGTVTHVFTNTIGIPSPVGQPVKISLTFDPSLVVIDPLITFGGKYLMSGGNTSFNVQVGEHVSDPINKFRMDAIPENCCASSDLYQFLNYDAPGTFIGINFPGFAENATVAFAFKQRFVPGPITSDALPLVQPNPADFRDARITINKQEGGNIVFSFNSTNLQIAVPEPTSVMLVLVAAVCGMAGVRRRINPPSAH